MTYSIPGLTPNFGGVYPTEKLKLLALGAIVLGIILFIISSLSTPKYDPKLKEIFENSPNKEISALVLCKVPCPDTIEGKRLTPTKVVVVEKAVEIKNLAKLPEVLQIQYLGEV